MPTILRLFYFHTAVCGLSKVDVVIILDSSTSVSEENFQKMRNFAKDLVEKADVDSGSVRFGAVKYSTKEDIQFHLNEYQTSAQIKAAIDAIPYSYGSTNSADALLAMHAQMFVPGRGDRPDADNIAFMITDGVSNVNYRRTIPEADSAKQKGIEIYAIGRCHMSLIKRKSFVDDPSSWCHGILFWSFSLAFCVAIYGFI